MSRPTLFWGDYPVIGPAARRGIFVLDHELEGLEQALPGQLPIVGAQLYQDECIVPEAQIVTDDIPCLRTLHTIKLVEYYEHHQSIVLELQKILENDAKAEKRQSPEKVRKKALPKQVQDEDVIDISSLQPALPLPEPTEFQTPISRDSSGESSFVKGTGESLPQISSSVATEILRKAVAAILAHAGFETTTSRNLDLLTDAAEGYFETLCKTFAHHKSLPQNSKKPLFPNVLQHALRDMKIPSMTALSDFYEKRVINYHSEMMRRCVKVHKEYERLRQSKRLAEIAERLQNVETTTKKSRKSDTKTSNGTESEESFEENLDDEDYESHQKRTLKGKSRSSSATKDDDPKLEESLQEDSSHAMEEDHESQPESSVPKDDNEKKKLPDAKKAGKRPESPKPSSSGHVAEEHKKELSRKRTKTKRM